MGIAFAIAFPLGASLGARQGRRLAAVPPTTTRWAVALGIWLLTLGLLLLRFLGAGGAQLTALGLLALGASGCTELAARRPPLIRLDESGRFGPPPLSALVR